MASRLSWCLHHPIGRFLSSAVISDLLLFICAAVVWHSVRNVDEQVTFWSWTGGTDNFIFYLDRRSERLSKLARCSTGSCYVSIEGLVHLINDHPKICHTWRFGVSQKPQIETSGFGLFPWRRAIFGSSISFLQLPSVTGDIFQKRLYHLGFSYDSTGASLFSQRLVVHLIPSSQRCVGFWRVLSLSTW